MLKINLIMLFPLLLMILIVILVFLHKYLYVLKIYGSHLDLLFDGKTNDASNQPPIFKQFIDFSNVSLPTPS